MGDAKQEEESTCLEMNCCEAYYGLDAALSTGCIPLSVQVGCRIHYRLDASITTGWMPPSLQVGCHPHYRLDAALTMS